MQAELKKVYLGLGTNLGDKLANLQEAVQLISQSIGAVTLSSSVFKTEPWGIEDQPDFFNQAVLIQTAYEPEEVLEKLLQIERNMGRERIQKWGTRIIDLDILLYEDLIINTPTLILPHPFMQDRNFVLVPLAEIAPGFIHPVLEQSILQLLEKSTDPLKVSPLFAET